MSDRPTIHLTNGTRRLWTDRVLTIMRSPRRWELHEGYVEALRPNGDALRVVKASEAAFQQGLITPERHAGAIAAYRERFEEQLRRHGPALMPGRLTYMGWTSHMQQVPVNTVVGDNVTLTCSCSKEAAARGECHRVWASNFLHGAGWRVVLDGIPFTPETP